jgi:hypothetical protein
MEKDAHPARPFAFLAALSFLAGFVGYLALSLPVVSTVLDEPEAPARVSGPTSAEWNLERHV